MYQLLLDCIKYGQVALATAVLYSLLLFLLKALRAKHLKRQNPSRSQYQPRLEMSSCQLEQSVRSHVLQLQIVPNLH